MRLPNEAASTKVSRLRLQKFNPKTKLLQVTLSQHDLEIAMVGHAGSDLSLERIQRKDDISAGFIFVELDSDNVTKRLVLFASPFSSKQSPRTESVENERKRLSVELSAASVVGKTLRAKHYKTSPCPGRIWHEVKELNRLNSRCE